MANVHRVFWFYRTVKTLVFYSPYLTSESYNNAHTVVDFKSSLPP